MKNVFTFPDGRQFALCYAQFALGPAHRQDTPLRSLHDIDQLMNYLGGAKLTGIWQNFYLNRSRAQTASPTAPISEIRKHIKTDLWQGNLYFIPRDAPEDKPENIDTAIRTARTNLQMHLRGIIQEEQKEKAALEAEYKKLGTAEKALVSTGAAMTGLGKAAKDFLIWADNIVDVVDINRRAVRIAHTAKTTYWEQNKKSWGQNLAEAEYKELIEALGFDPAKITRAQITEALELAQLIWDDPETRNLLKLFAIDYAKTQHHTEWTEMAGSLSFEIILTLIIAALTGGAGGVAVAAKNMVLIGRLEKAGKALLTIGKKLKSLKVRAKRKLISVKNSLTSSGPAPKSKHDSVDDVMHKASEKPSGVLQPIVKTPTQPTSLVDALDKLKAAQERIAKNGYQSKYTDAELEQMAKSGKVPNERFYVRFSTAPMDKAKNLIEAETNEGPLGYQRTSGRHPLWMSTFDQVENADSDPKLIAALFGTQYDPSKKYVMYVMDMGENYAIDGPDVFVPTFANMKTKLKTEFAGDIPPDHIDTIMTPEYAEEFKGHWAEFGAWAEREGYSTWDPETSKQFAASDYFKNETEAKLFSSRSQVLNEIGAWDIFTGNGTTENLTGMGKRGALEVLTIQHDPASVKDMVSGPNPKATMIKLW